MRILVAHNYYGSAAPSGENQAVDLEKSLLRDRGHEVSEFTRNSDKIIGEGTAGAIRGALAALWNPFARRALRSVLARERPEILHVHNTFPLLSPSVFHAVRGVSPAVVLTLHNYRLICASALLFRDGKACVECLEAGSVLPGLRHACYRGSRLATAPVAAMIALHRSIGTWKRCVDAFVVLTPFQRDLMVRAGLPEEAIHVKPNFHPDPPVPVPWGSRREEAVFLGRLSGEKGVRLLLDAWGEWRGNAPRLKIVGDGPDRTALERLAMERGLGGRVEFTGRLPYPEAQEVLGNARLLLVPSLCFEGFPMVIREAYAMGVPVAASRLGALPGIVDEERTGYLFPPGDPDSIRHCVEKAFSDVDSLVRAGAGARRVFEERYTADRCYDSLMQIYRSAILGRGRRIAGRTGAAG